MIKILYITILAILLSGCSITARKTAENETKTLLEQINPATGKHYTPKEIKQIKQIDAPEKDSGSLVKIIFYGCGALCVLIAAGILIVLKDVKTALMAFCGGLLFCVVPFTLDLLYELLGALKWILGLSVAVLMGALVIYCLFRLWNIGKDLCNEDLPDKDKITERIRELLRK